MCCGNSPIAAKNPNSLPKLEDLARPFLPEAKERYVNGELELTLKSGVFSTIVVSFPHEVVEKIEASSTSAQQKKIGRIFAEYSFGLIPKEDLKDTAGIVSRVKEIVQVNPRRRDLKEVIAELGENIKLGIKKKTVFFIGPSQVGKTTTVNRLLGFPCTFLSREKLGLTGKGKILVIQPKKDRNGNTIYPKAKVGNGDTSETGCASLYGSEEEPISYCDCPGAEDSRTDEGLSEASQQRAQLDLTNVISVRELLDTTKEIQGFAVFVEHDSLFTSHTYTDMGKKFKSAVSYLGGLLNHKLDPYKNNLWIVATKLPETWWGGHDKSNEEVCKQMSHWLEAWQDLTQDAELKTFYQELNDWIQKYPNRVIMYEVESDRDTKNLKTMFCEASPLTTKSFGYPLSPLARDQVKTVGQSAQEALLHIIRDKSDERINNDKEKLLKGSITDRISHLKMLKDTLAKSLNIEEILGPSLTQDSVWISNEPMWRKTKELNPSQPSPFASCSKELRSRLKKLILTVETELYSNREILRDQSFDKFLEHCNMTVDPSERPSIEALMDRAKDRLKLRDFLLDEKNTKKRKDILAQSNQSNFDVHNWSRSQLKEFVGSAFPSLSLNTDIEEWNEDELGFLRQLLDQNLIHPLRVNVSQTELTITSQAERVCISVLQQKINEQKLNNLAHIHLQITHPEGQGVLYLDEDVRIEGNIPLFITTDSLHIPSQTHRTINVGCSKWPPNKFSINIKRPSPTGGTYSIS